MAQSSCLDRESDCQTHPCSSLNAPPGYIAGYLTAIAQRRGLNPNTYINDVLGYLTQLPRCLNATNHYFNVPELCLLAPPPTCFECTQCRRPT